MYKLWVPAFLLWSFAAVWLGSSARVIPESHALYVWGALVCAFGLAVLCFGLMYQTARQQKDGRAKSFCLLYLGLTVVMLAAAIVIGRLPADFVLVG